uniref:Peptidase A2 domain-containing protein n=1 Tax=Romanomermis culicivorax TaxID=13658 RepID=A0A915IL55_ROMCU
MHNATISKISTIHPRPFNRPKPIFESALMISMVNSSGDHAAEHPPKEVQIIPAVQGTIFMKNTYAVYPNRNFPSPWEQRIHYNAVPAPYVTTPTDSSCTSSQSPELPLALPALPSSTTISATTLDTRTLNQSTSTTNMVIPSKEIASAAPITFVHKYASTRAFQIPIKLGKALIDTGALCSVLSSGLVKHAFDKQSLQLPICGKIKVADVTVVNAHGPVVITMESAFGEHMINQPEEIEAEQLIGQAQPSPHQQPPGWLEVTELTEPIFLVAQVSVSILPHCQQW